MPLQPSTPRPSAAPAPAPETVMAPAAPALAVGGGRAAWLSEEGEIEELEIPAAARRLTQAPAPPVYFCHGGDLATRLDLARPVRGLDLLELFAFVRPATSCAPTPGGLARACGLAMPEKLTEEPAILWQVASLLLAELAMLRGDRAGRRARDTAQAMARGGWVWADAVLHALAVPGQAGDGTDTPDTPDTPDTSASTSRGLDIWRLLPEWEDEAPPTPPGDAPVAPREARRRLARLLGTAAEDRPGQADYASAACPAFAPRESAGAPNLVLAEAGTGVGKTLGYIAPASLWAERNGGPVWLSTYSRNLQHQIDAELSRLYPDAASKRRHVVVRKGRENYLCLLNLQESVRATALAPRGVVGLGLIARWAGATRDGDMKGGDFPAWLGDLPGARPPHELTDRRGECIHTACPHYRRCFIEDNIRRARRADLVIANHALVMVRAANAATGAEPLTRLVLDEGQHVFDAADSAFAAWLSGRETAELRLWIRGAETRGRAPRGLEARIGDLAAGTPDAEPALAELLAAATALPGPVWQTRLADDRPTGPAEVFLAAVRAFVLARASGGETGYGLEYPTQDASPQILDAATQLQAHLRELIAPAARLRSLFLARLDADAARLESATRIRLEQGVRALDMRVVATVGEWITMLHHLTKGDGKGEGEDNTENNNETNTTQHSGEAAGDDDAETANATAHKTTTADSDAFVHWFALERSEGRDMDIGLRRHWLDPTRPFVNLVVRPAHGLVVTSATLTDSGGRDEGEGERAWQAAEARTGALHLSTPAIRAQLPSPFDYESQSRILIVTDTARNDTGRLATAFRELFLASGGGALGLFTAVARLRAVHKHLVRPLNDAGLRLYAQHVDGLNLPGLIDIFRLDANSCLLGTDAVRDGVDVPGAALRLIVMERVPWPRPTLLHKARRAHFGGHSRGSYDDMLARLRMKQAFGRLVRRAGDRGVFVMLDAKTPSRLLDAFPAATPVARLELAPATAAVGHFLAADPHQQATATGE